MAYAAVNSLLRTLDVLYSTRISVESTRYSSTSSQVFIKVAFKCAKSLRNALEKFNLLKNSSAGVMDLDAQIRDEARKLEDAVESLVSAQFLSQSQSYEGCPPQLFLKLVELRKDIACFAVTAKKMEENYIKELYIPSPEEVEDASVSSPAIYSGRINQCDMVGLSDQFFLIRDALLFDNSFIKLPISISGMAGIGKTALAEKIFDDSLIKANFECRAFVRVGQKFRLEETMQAIIAQVNLDNDKMVMREDEGLNEYFHRCLTGRKFLIVLDDVWESRSYYDFSRKLPKDFLKSRILVTCRENGTAEYISIKHFSVMRFMDEEESWELLRKKVFGEEECPYQLVKAGRKIAENCEGLPLLIVAIAQLLSKSEKNPEYWNDVAEKRNSVFVDALDQILEVLLPSYRYLNQDLKACFLYLGAYPQGYIIRCSRIVKLWDAEGFVGILLSYVFDKLVSSNLVVVRQRSSSSGRTKVCSLHCAFWHLSKKEAEKIKFLHILNSCADGSIERIKNKPILSIYTNTLFAIKEVHNSMASVSTVRSLLCTGPYHQYQVPKCLEWRLLRVLNALTIRFYEFPVDVANLILLRYLSLSCNANLPRSISKLWNLQYLIVHQHMSIKQVAVESYVPVEIWDLQELVHLQIMGRNLPGPPPNAYLLKLEELLDIGAQSCTKRVLDRIPHLKKLRTQIELAPDVIRTLSFFDHISCLDELKSLQIVIKNPKLLREPLVPSLSISISSLQKLSLSGFGYPWEDMGKIAELPCLEVLKLKCFAFRGEMWEGKGKTFSSLRIIFIEDTDLVQWTAENETFPKLLRLSMKYCHKLRKIPLLSSLTSIELVDCNPLAETYAKKWYDHFVNVEYSWK